jgi:hypothetical protein
MTTYTLESKQILRDDITFIDQQLTLARNKMREGDKGEAWSVLDGLLDYYDFKRHFPDIMVNEGEVILFKDMYEALRAIDDIIEIDAIQILTGGNPYEWRPGYSREEILRRIEAFLRQIEIWLALNWFEGDEIADSLELLKEKIEAFIRFFQNYNGGYLFGQVIDIRNAKKRLWRSLSDELPFAEIYELLLSMDRNLTFLVFRFRLHLEDVTLEQVESIIRGIEKDKHAILAIIDATRAENETAPLQPPPGDDSTPLQPPPGWDDLQPFPPAGYAFIGNSLLPIRASRRDGTVSVIQSIAGAGSGKAAKTRIFLIAGLIGLVIGVVVASIVVSLLSGANCVTG